MIPLSKPILVKARVDLNIKYWVVHINFIIFELTISNKSKVINFHKTLMFVKTLMFDILHQISLKLYYDDESDKGINSASINSNH